MAISKFSTYTVVLITAIFQSSALDTFTAAVYEHAVILTGAVPKLVTPEEALSLMNKNLDVLEGAIEIAAKQGAKIIVTPEDGIYGWVFTRETIYPYLEDIPDPQVNWNPCNEPERFGSTPVQKRLSCMAKNYSIYVVANMGDKKACNSSDPQCPSDGHYQYNTNVVYDSEGKFLARYHKVVAFLHLRAPKCITLIWKHKTASFYLQNLMYIPVFLPHTLLQSTGVRMLQVSSISHQRSKHLLEVFILMISPEEAGNYTVCHRGLCCHLSYQLSEKQDDEIYALGAFDGLHVVEGEYYLQICTLLKCKNTDSKSCGQRADTAHTKFDSFSLCGTFNTTYVFPEVLFTGTQLAPGEFQVLADGCLISNENISKPILTVALFGRWYEKDPPHPLYTIS